MINMAGSGGSPNNQAPESESAAPTRLSDDQFYRALRSVHRRRLLYYLLDNPESTVQEIATVLCGWQASTTGTMKTPEDRSDVLLVLKHNHLPRLADAEMVDYNPQNGTVHLESLHPFVADIIRRSVEAARSEHT